jgi:hypothetical protein
VSNVSNRERVPTSVTGNWFKPSIFGYMFQADRTTQNVTGTLQTITSSIRRGRTRKAER